MKLLKVSGKNCGKFSFLWEFLCFLLQCNVIWDIFIKMNKNKLTMNFLTFFRLILMLNAIYCYWFEKINKSRNYFGILQYLFVFKFTWCFLDNFTTCACKECVILSENTLINAKLVKNTPKISTFYKKSTNLKTHTLKKCR